MNFDEAYARVAMAGRQLGSGPAVAAERLTDFAHGVEWLTDKGCPVNNARAILLGTAVGLVMAEDKIALETLERIEQECKGD